MPDIHCPVAGCDYSTGDVDSIVVAALLNAHTVGTHSASQPIRQQRQPPKVERPQLSDAIDEEEWNAFQQNWEMFIRANDIAVADQSIQLFSCCDSALKAKLTSCCQNVFDKSVQELLTLLASLAVIPVAVSVKRNELLQMHQDSGESIRNFLLRIRGKAVTCKFKVQCPHTHTAPAGQVYVDYTDEMIRHVILNGIYDDDIKREVFSKADLDSMLVNDLVSVIEGKELARDATKLPSTGSISQHKKKQKDEGKAQDTEREGKCPTCNSSFKLYRKLRSGRLNKKPFTHCFECWKKQTSSQTKTKSNDTDTSTESSAVSFEISTAQLATDPKHSDPGEIFCAANIAKSKQLTLNHHIFTDGNWKRKLAQPHPTVELTVSTDNGDYEGFGFESPHIREHPVEGITDSGAQCCLMGYSDCQAAGFKRQDLIPVRQKLNAVSRMRINIYGAVILRMSGKSPSGKVYSCAAIVYVSPDVSGLYLSKEAMIQLQIIPADFPKVGGAASAVFAAVKVSTSQSIAECGCPLRTMPPGAPDKLPFTCNPNNIEKMKKWLFDRYGSSTFNTCPHQILPDMEGPPVSIHVNPRATPVAVHVPSQIPLHWQEKVEQDLKRDELLDVIEKVPHGEPSTWCHRMVISRKENGEPRRTVDLSPLNKHCVREVHATRAPFELAKAVPARTWRTVTDAWNGFHSVPLRLEDRHLTTFITPWGRYRYKRAPQGFASSGDGYNRRFDEVLSDFKRQKRCVDDVIHYDEDLNEHWWRTIELLELVGRNGVVLNPDKFQFSQRTVDFAGFRISECDIEPLPKYLDAIRNFPTPKSITDVRSWFGLVNQVSHYAQLRTMIEPFRKFLSPKVKFYWDDSLDSKFKASKSLIVEAIREGVKIFDPLRKSCLRCDWSKAGIGHYLCQKHCKCESVLPGCCDDGWRITLCGSRFLRKSEERYAPVEGEALSVAWGLEHSKYFTLGCDDLLIIVDHKPLTKILGDRTLDEIPNPRLFRLKQRTLPWLYDITWMPGIDNLFSDATSRHPVFSEDMEINSFAIAVSALLATDGDHIEDIAMVQVKSALDNVTAVTWERIQEATYREYDELLKAIEDGSFPMSLKKETNFPEFHDYKNGLYVHDGVILYEDRVVVPPSLRSEVLDSLHAAHQGETAMLLTAQSCVFWPGLAKSVAATRGSCRPCIKNAPSQARLDPIPPRVPTTPFECVVADYFDFQAMHYLVIADRLSGWSEAYRIKPQSGSKGLVRLLKQFFGTFGVPEEISSDEGKEFIANVTQDFFLRWGIKHRLSSAYNPQSNGRAELAVKSTKRLLEDNIGSDGELDTDKFLRAMLIKRNTPDPATKLSPAEIIFGRKLRDSLPRILKEKNIFFNDQFRSTWRDAWKQKEIALRSRYQGCQKRLGEHSKALPPLCVGDRVAIQNQYGKNPNKWERTGTIVEERDFDKYVTKVDGSGRLTLRNRRFLKKLYQDEGMFQNSLLPLPSAHTSNNNVFPEVQGAIVPQLKQSCLPLVTDKVPLTGHTNLQKVPPSQESKQVSPVTPILAEKHVSWSNDVACNPPAEPQAPLNKQSQQSTAPHSQPTLPLVPEAPSCARTTRIRKPTKQYDASLGIYVDRNNRL